MDIFVSGYGRLDIDSDLVFVRHVFEEKIKLKKKHFIQQIWKNHMKCKTKQLNIITFHNLSFTKNNKRNINTKMSTVLSFDSELFHVREIYIFVH